MLYFLYNSRASMTENIQAKELPPDLLELAKKQQKHSETSSPRRKKFLSLGKLVVYLGVAIVISFLSFSYRTLSSVSNLLNDDTPLYKQISQLVNPADKAIEGEAENRVNILLIGKGGKGWSGGELADTIIIASIRPSTHAVAMISLPRDLYVDIPTLGWRKINNATAHGKATNYPGGGEKLMEDVVQTVTGLPIHYYATVDFTAFRDVVDELGGIDVTVEKSLYDPYYPTYDFGYQTVSIDAGEHHFNGEQALQYARSRKTTSDFDRARRQQKVLLAMKDTFLSIDTLFHPTKIIGILDSLGPHVSTNMKMWEMTRLVNLVKDVQPSLIVNTVVDNREGGVVHSETTPDGAYILVPNAGFGNFADIQKIAGNVFDQTAIAKEQARIEVQNGTKEVGLAQDTADKLLRKNYAVVNVGNIESDTESGTTTIYDLSNGAAPLTIKALEKEFGVASTSFAPPFLASDAKTITYRDLRATSLNVNIQPNPETGEKANIIIILGKDNGFQAQARRNSGPSS